MGGCSVDGIGVKASGLSPRKRGCRLKRSCAGLEEVAIRGAHARAFPDLLTQSMEDKAIDEPERVRIRELYRCLERLGWAPGQ